MTLCAATHDHNNHHDRLDHAQLMFDLSVKEKRQIVIDTAESLIAGKSTIQLYGGERGFEGHDGVKATIAEHPAFALLVQNNFHGKRTYWDGEVITLYLLTKRVAERMVAVSMFDEVTADLLNFKI